MGWFESRSLTKRLLDIAQTRLKKQKDKKVIIGDNFGCHYTDYVLKECKRHGTTFTTLIPNTTHIAQPLDEAVFSSVNKYLRQSLEV